MKNNIYQRISMFRLGILLSLVTALPVTANANAAISLSNISCSGALSISSLAGASLSCTGNFDLNGGLIASDSQIFIQAEGDLLLANLYLTAPEVSLSTITGNLQMASTVTIQTVPDQNNAGGQVVINSFPGQQSIDWKLFDLTLNPGSSVIFSMPSGSSSILDRFFDSGQIVIKSGDIKTTSPQLNISQVSTSSVPEANAGAMLLLGLGLLTLRRRSL